MILLKKNTLSVLLEFITISLIFLAHYSDHLLKLTPYANIFNYVKS